MITTIDKNTALVLIDLQNMIVANINTAHPVENILANANKLIDTFRNKNLPVVFVNVKPKDAAWMKSRKEVQMPAMPNDEHLFKITDKLHTKDSDIYITKHTWNAFFETALHGELQKRNITNIILGGISTSIGVEGTARAASELGYNISFALDAMTDRVKEAHERSVQFIFPRIGENGSTEDIMQKLEE